MTIRNVFLFENFKKIRRIFLSTAGIRISTWPYFKVFAYCEPQMNADERRRRIHQRSSVFIRGL
ncbi:MAG: hypothetical protein DRI57_19575 [Deltaproteobacteria bacterium]|nr:MAG: hypothetical protein DRI57_19575 [Deltaproteobacteria bacterium]